MEDILLFLKEYETKTNKRFTEPLLDIIFDPIDGSDKEAINELKGNTELIQGACKIDITDEDSKYSTILGLNRMFNDLGKFLKERCYTSVYCVYNAFSNQKGEEDVNDKDIYMNIMYFVCHGLSLNLYRRHYNIEVDGVKSITEETEVRVFLLGDRFFR